MPRRKPHPPFPTDVMEKLRQAGADATPPQMPVSQPVTRKQLIGAATLLLAAFLGAGVLTGLFLRLVLFVAGR